MKTVFVCLVVSCSLAPCLRADEKKAVPLYTNEDLQRVAPFRDETGVASSVTAPAPAGPSADSSRRPHGEDYWRREAQRLQDRLRVLRERAAELRVKIEQGQKRPLRVGRRGPALAPPRSTTEALEQRLAAVEREIRERESRLEERARRDGALPGWLR